MQFGFTLVSRKLNKRLFDINFKKQNKLKRKVKKKVKEGKKGEKRHIVSCFSTEEIVELSLNIDARC